MALANTLIIGALLLVPLVPRGCSGAQVGRAACWGLARRRAGGRGPAVAGRARTGRARSPGRSARLGAGRRGGRRRGRAPRGAAPGRTAHVTPDFQRFAIGFDERDRARLHELWDEIIDSQRWSEGALTARSRQAWARVERARRGRVLGLDGRGAGRAGVRAACAARPCCARRTRSWRRRWRRCTPGRGCEFVDCNREDLCMSFEDFEAQGRAPPAEGGDPRAHRRPHRVRRRADRRAVPRRGHLPDRGLRARARRRLERPAAGQLGRRRRVVVLRHQDDLDGRGRDAVSPPRRAARVRARCFATTASPSTPSRGSTSA